VHVLHIVYRNCLCSQCILGRRHNERNPPRTVRAGCHSPGPPAGAAWSLTGGLPPGGGCCGGCLGCTGSQAPQACPPRYILAHSNNINNISSVIQVTESLNSYLSCMFYNIHKLLLLLAAHY